MKLHEGLMFMIEDHMQLRFHNMVFICFFQSPSSLQREARIQKFLTSLNYLTSISTSERNRLPRKEFITVRNYSYY